MTWLYINMSSILDPLWYKFTFLIFNHSHSILLWQHMNWIDPLIIFDGEIIPASWSFTISLLPILSCLVWDWWTCLTLSSKRILCIYIGYISSISKRMLCTSSSHYSWSKLKLLKIITWLLISSSKKAYFKCIGSDFSSVVLF